MSDLTSVQELEPRQLLSAGPVTAPEDASGAATVGGGGGVPTTISGAVWHDLNADGIQDAGERGFVGFTVRLYDADGAMVDRTFTSGRNGYRFDGVVPGVYNIEVEPPLVSAPTIMPLPGFYGSPRDQGADDALDSDFNPATLSTGEIQVTEAVDLDLGLYRLATIGGQVWADENSNGLQDSGEPGVPGIVVDLLDATGGVTDSRPTDAMGSYEFETEPGSYHVRFNIPDGLELTLPGDGTSTDTDSDPDPVSTTAPVTARSAAVNRAIDAGVTVRAEGDTPGVTCVATDGSTHVTEDGETDALSFALDSIPQSSVTIVVTPDDQTDLGAGAGVDVRVTFSPETALTPQTVDVAAINDSIGEGPHSGVIRVETVSEDRDYNAIVLPDIEVGITDAAGAWIGPAPGNSTATALFVNGTDGDDDIRVRTGRPGAGIRGRFNGRVFTIDAAADLLLVDAGAGDDTIRVRTDSPVTVMAGAGNDRVATGRGHDVIDGGTGDDTLKGGKGNDLIRGGDGADLIRGNAGHDIVLGDQGADTLVGGRGRDVLIGGTQADAIRGRSAGDIMIGGTTAYDGDESSLNSIRTLWTGAGTAEERSARIQAGNTPLQSGVTVFDDSAVDSLGRGYRHDWMFAAVDDLLRRTPGLFDVL